MLVEIVVEEGGNHVVGGGNGVEVAREVEVDAFHGQHLCVAAACRAAFHAKAGTEGGLAQSHDGTAAYLVQSQGEADRHGGLADACLGGGDGGDEDKLACLAACPFYKREGELGDVLAVVLDVVGADAHSGCHLSYGLEGRGVCNFDVFLHFYFVFFTGGCFIAGPRIIFYCPKIIFAGK